MEMKTEEGIHSSNYKCGNRDRNRKEPDLRLVDRPELDAKGLCYLQGKDCLLFICIFIST